MKKFFILLVAFIVSVVTVSAQSSVLLKSTKYIYGYVGTDADSINASTDSVWTQTIQLNKLDGIFYNASVKVKDFTAGATCKIILRGKIFDSDEFTTISTVLWKGGGTDTTVIFTANTNKVYYRYLDFKLSGTANKAKLEFIKLSLKK